MSIPLGWPELQPTELKKSPLIAPSSPGVRLAEAQCEIVPRAMSPLAFGRLSPAAIRLTCGSPSFHESL